MFGICLIIIVAIATSIAYPNVIHPNLNRTDVRIVGGNETTIEEHPWQVSLRDANGHYCGGSLISKDTVLTAGHCASGTEVGKEKVVVGTSSLSKGGTEFDIASFVINDDKIDIAIFKLKGEVELSDSVQIINLPEQGEMLPDGTEATVTGWGLEHDDIFVLPDILREVKVNIISNSKCNESYPNNLNEFMICAGVNDGGKDACKGDSGGPLAAGDILYGIVSWGSGCGQPGYPGVYTNVANLRTWIKENSGI